MYTAAPIPSNLVSGVDLMLYLNLLTHTSDSASIGIITKNIALQLTRSVTTPPRVGPMDAPRYTLAVLMLRATPLSCLL